MKSLKAVAVVAGSLVIAGSAAPAFAHGTADHAPSNLDSVVNALTEDSTDVKPSKRRSKAPDTENKDSVLHAVKDTTKRLNSGKGLLGGLPLGG
ncbi:hypothetical protein [Streptomyces sp. NPDC017890]|uniref:hypothetical protein n=1 Tax=Streptomyces sp. NPDC017890 TaxID=3365015 RepID=UPI00379D8741